MTVHSSGRRMSNGGWRQRGAAIGLCLGLSGLADCGRPPPPPTPTCQPPRPIVTPSATPEQLAHDALYNCVKQAAYRGVLRGGPVNVAASAAVNQCADSTAAYLKAIRAARPLTAYERGVIVDEVVQTAQSTAAQKRSRGCGRPGGQPETLMDTDSR